MTRKIAIVVQRYGLEINGGAEYHARLIAERLAKYFGVEVFTTTAMDYVTWAHHYAEGMESVNGIPVHRFRVQETRDPVAFGEIQAKIFTREHSAGDEQEWLRREGPLVPHLIDTLERRNHEFDFFLFFSYRYYHSYHGVKRFGPKSVLVPTAEHDEVIYLRLFKDFFHLPAAIAYNSHEERALIHRVSGNQDVPGDIVGVGSEIPSSFSPGAFRETHGITGPYILYVGRLDENKGVPELLDHFTRLREEEATGYSLVLMGQAYIDVPENPSIHHLGFVDDRTKFDGLTGADFLVIPSQYESLSMVSLEAWACGKPVVANGRTEVLQGQCRRSNAGLWYTDYDGFREIVLLLQNRRDVRESLGKNGRRFFMQHYAWPVIENKYLGLFNRLAGNGGGVS